MNKLIMFVVSGLFVTVALIFSAYSVNAKAQSSTGSFCYNWSENLTVGSYGSGVRALNQALLMQNISGSASSEGQPQTFISDDGVFTERTSSAVTAFQEKYAPDILVPNNLVHGTGYVGPSTRAKLNKLYGCVASVTPTPVITAKATPVSTPAYRSSPIPAPTFKVVPVYTPTPTVVPTASPIYTTPYLPKSIPKVTPTPTYTVVPTPIVTPTPTSKSVTITVATPVNSKDNSGLFSTGETIPLSWSSRAMGVNRIYLLSEDGNNKIFTIMATNDNGVFPYLGSNYSWKIPSNIPTGSYKIRVIIGIEGYPDSLVGDSGVFKIKN